MLYYSMNNKDIKTFITSSTFKNLMNRWKDKDMEQYFIDKSKQHLEDLKKQVKKK